MSGLIERIQDRSATSDEKPRIIELTDGDADEVLDALASDTRRETFRELILEPATSSELAERLETSVQNTHYHVEQLERADLVEPIDTVYSEKGNEMTVYGPASDPLVFVGDRDRTSHIRQSLRNVVAGLGLLAGASLLVQWGAEQLIRSRSATTGAAGPASQGGSGFADGSFGWVVFEVIEPGILFFTVCLVLAAVVTISMHR